MERIDRAWADRRWQVMFVKAEVLHLVRTHFDHHPLLLSLYGENQSQTPKNPGFLNAWTTHPEFVNVVGKYLHTG